MSNKSKLSVEEFYNGKLKEKLHNLDKLRKEILEHIKKYVLIGILLGLVTGCIGLLIDFIFILPILLIPFIIFSIVKVNPLWKNYYNRFKSEIIKEIILFINPDLSYDSTKKISKNIYKKSGIFQHSVDSYSGDDYVSGFNGETQIEFSELHTQYKTETYDSKGNRHEHWHTIFRGIFFSADFSKNFNAKTFVLTDTAEKLFGFLGTKFQKINKSYGELVKLEDPVFEEKFVVYSDNQTEARYLLSPSMMERITTFVEKSNKKIQLSFVDSRLYIAIPFNKSLFEPKLFGEIVGVGNVKEYYSDLLLANDLVDDLNLNVRIWSKE